MVRCSRGWGVYRLQQRCCVDVMQMVRSGRVHFWEELFIVLVCCILCARAGALVSGWEVACFLLHGWVAVEGRTCSLSRINFLLLSLWCLCDNLIFFFFSQKRHCFPHRHSACRNDFLQERKFSCFQYNNCKLRVKMNNQVFFSFLPSFFLFCFRLWLGSAFALHLLTSSVAARQELHSF